jgi:hypothetical protein
VIVVGGGLGVRKFNVRGVWRKVFVNMRFEFIRIWCKGEKGG